MAKKRLQTWAAVAVIGVGLIIAAILGLFVYVSVTIPTLHPDAQAIKATSQSDPAAEWAAAVEQSRQLVRTTLAEQNLPAMSIAVGAAGSIVWAEAFGWSDLESHAAASPRTKFRMGSTAIALTSVAAGQLLERERLKLDDEIQTYVRAFPKKEWPVTVRQLMAHTAGVRTDNGDEEDLSERCGRTTDALTRFADNRLRFEPDTSYHFSNYGWILVSAAVEAAAAEPFFNVIARQILEPLGMNDTRPDSSGAPHPDRATFYYPRFAANTRYGPELAREGDYACFAGAGGFLSTPSDLVRFGLAVTSGKLLQPATLKILQTPHRLRSGQETGYGLGWDLEEVSLAGAMTRQFGHDGEYFLGGSSSFFTFPEKGIVVAVMANTSFADVSGVAVKVAQAFAESPRKQP